VITSLKAVEALAANHKVVPVVHELFSGAESPVTIFEKVAGTRPGSFLLESAEHGVWSRYSFIGVNSRGVISKTEDGKIIWNSKDGHSPFPSGSTDSLLGTALEALSQLCASWSTAAIPGLPPLTSGLVGTMGWDIVREIENLPNAPRQSYKTPQMVFAMTQDVIVIDHQTSKLLLVSNIFVESPQDVSRQYETALKRIDDMLKSLTAPTKPFLAGFNASDEISAVANLEQSEFIKSIHGAKHYVEIGDVFQVVLSQRFDIEAQASALDVYRVLRALNPSPYMYLFNLRDEAGEFAIVGSSPEALVKVTDRHAVMHPIAGSRPRGADWDEDQLLEESLQSDAKERAEHLMLVDLARNDLLKVCEPTSVAVTEFMQVHKFSHIQHLVSTVEGRVLGDKSVVDVFRATFPAGTLSGAPKPRALQIIDELEGESRGIFGGVVGYFDFAGNADLAIAIRTIFLRDKVARVQAGAGVVLDSDPQMEYEETKSKASAPLKAVQIANRFVRVS